MRQFFEYNDDLICTREITDNGTGESKDDLTSVTVRKIKVITPRTEDSFYGMPASIEERYLDQGSEVSLSKTDLTYSPQGKITRKDLYDANGNFRYSLHYTYDQKGKLIEETNAIGQVAKSSYDENGNMITYEDFSGRRKNEMTYDFSNRLLQKHETDDQGLSRITHHRYDFKDRVTTEIDHFGNETHHEYYQYGKFIRCTQFPSTQDEWGNTITPVIHYEYDSAGNKIVTIDTRGEITRSTYNSRGKPLTITYPDGSQERFVYNIDGTLNYAVDQLGTTTSYTYDYQKRETSKTTEDQVETYTYDAFHLLSKTDADGNTTYYTYDGAGRLIAEQLGTHLKEFTYDELGRLSSTISGTSISIKEYDALNRPIEERVEDNYGTVLTRVLYEYDCFGNKSVITRFIEGRPTSEYFYYDAFNRPIKQVDALGNVTTLTYDEKHLNALGQYVLKKVHTDPNGIQTIEIHSVQGKVVSVEKLNAFSEQISLEELHYDIGGNLARQVSSILSPVAPPRSTTTLWEYGCMNRLIAITEAHSTSEEKTTRFTYSLKGQHHHIFKPDGVVIENTYDSLNRLILQTSSDGTYQQTFSYDRLNRLISSSNILTGATTQRIYDPHGNIIHEQLANNHTLTNTYDNRGRRTHLLLPDNSSINYDYDALYLRQVDRYDRNNAYLYSHRYIDFDESGHLLAEDYINNLGQASYTIDPLGRVRTIDSPYFEQSIDALDPAGHILAMSWKSPLSQDTQEYAYDDHYQLINEQSQYSHTFAYDSHHNRLNSDGDPNQINSLNQLLSTSTTQYNYDLNGNLTSKITPTEEIHYRYDPLDRLVEIEYTGKKLYRYTYDNFHRRLSSTSYAWSKTLWQKDEHLSYIYDGQNEIGAIGSDGRIAQLRVLGSTPRAEIGAAIAIELNHQVYLPIHDIQGHVRSIVSPRTSQIAESYNYSAFKEEDSHSRLRNPWRFSSKRTDDTGLIFYGRRYYDPEIGRWITPDPKGFADGPNLYSFVHNDPLLKVDLYGLEAFFECLNEPWFLDNAGRPGKFNWNDNKESLKSFNFNFQRKIQEISPLRVDSHSYTIGNLEFGKGGIGFINGINNSPSESKTHASRLSKYAGGAKINGVYNATHTVAIDAFECKLNQLGVLTPPVFELMQQWENFHKTAGADEKFLQLSHSGGASHVYNALRFSPKAVRDRIICVAIAPATIIPNELCFKSYNYVSRNDFVPCLNSSSFIKHFDELIILNPHQQAHIWDHNYDSPTYTKVVEDHIMQYIDNYGRLK